MWFINMVTEVARSYPNGFLPLVILKNEVYRRKPITIEDLKNFIKEEAESILPEIRRNAIDSFRQMLQICIDNGGFSVETY